MTTINEISKSYAGKYHEHKAREEKAEAHLNRLTKQVGKATERRSKLYGEFPSWMDNIIKPIADELSRHFPDYRYDILGPFGICNEVSIHFYEKGIDDKKLWEGGHIKVITFIPIELSGGKIAVRDTSVDTGQYGKGTIGEMNGMNHPTVDIPTDANTDWLLQYVRG